MSVSQISVFVESRPGHMARILDAFHEAKINVRGYSASDTGDYGIVRFIVDAPDRALAVLKDMGAAAVETEVLCALLPDVPGELARIMGIMARRGINVEYSYSLISTFIAMSVKDLDAAQRALEDESIELIDQNDLVDFPAAMAAEARSSQEGR